MYWLKNVFHQPFLGMNYLAASPLNVTCPQGAEEQLYGVRSQVHVAQRPLSRSVENRCFWEDKFLLIISSLAISQNSSAHLSRCQSKGAFT